MSFFDIYKTEGTDCRSKEDEINQNQNFENKHLPRLQQHIFLGSALDSNKIGSLFFYLPNPKCNDRTLSNIAKKV